MQGQYVILQQLVDATIIINRRWMDAEAVCDLPGLGKIVAVEEEMAGDCYASCLIAEDDGRRATFSLFSGSWINGGDSSISSPKTEN